MYRPVLFKVVAAVIQIGEAAYLLWLSNSLRRVAYAESIRGSILGDQVEQCDEKGE